MKGETSVSLERLHRLRPSDIEAIRDRANQNESLATLVATFARYLADLKNPREVELDDVIRIALQLKAATVWEKVKPSDFRAAFKDRLNPRVFAALNDALDDPSEDERAAVGKTSLSIVRSATRQLGETEPASMRDLTRSKSPTGADRSYVQQAKGLAAREQKIGDQAVPLHHSRLRMSKSALIEKIATATELSKRDVKSVMETLTDVGHKELKKNGLFLVPGFAKFVVIKKPATKARKGTNPFTGEEMMFKAKPARKIVRARPVKATRDSA